MQKTAAAMLQVEPRRLRQMEDAPWWNDELRTADGYDVCGIVRAQLTHSGSADDDDLKQRRAIAQTEREELQRHKAELEVWELERQKEETLGNILPAAVYLEFIRELLGMIRERVAEIPFRVSKYATPKQKPLVYITESKIKKPSDAAPLQREVQKLLDEVQQWLDQGTDELQRGTNNKRRKKAGG